MANPQWAVESVKFTSDQAYELGSRQVELSFTDTNGRSIIDEIAAARIRGEASFTEFSSSNQVRWKATPNSPEYTSTNRSIFIGTFNYEGNQLRSAQIKKWISWGHFNTWNQNIIKSMELQSGYTIRDSSTIAEWEKLYEYWNNNAKTIFKYDDVNWDPLTNSPPTSTTTVKQFLDSADGQKYFKSNWYNDPTSDNVLVDISLDSASSDMSLSQSTKVDQIISEWFSAASNFKQSLELTEVRHLDITASSWSDKIKIKGVALAASTGSKLEASQIEFGADARQGWILNGSNSSDELWGKAGWDIFDGGAGSDLVRAGNGRDIITGGLGADELHGDFGWNTYKSEKDGFRDLIAIKSDQWLVNWLYGKAGNNANGEKADVIEGLDSTDQIKIIGAYTSELSFLAGASSHGVSGIGIYAKGALEALYVGGDLSVAQIAAMTSGDASSAAMNNQITSYGWSG